jgi:hypothetical protein
VKQARLGMPQLDLTDEEATAPLVELNRLIDSDRYPLSPRVRRFPLAPRIRCCAEFARSCRALRLNRRPWDHCEPAGRAMRNSAFGALRRV